MTSSDSSERTIFGLNVISDTTDLVPVSKLIRNTLLFSETFDNDTLNLILPLNYSLKEGLGLWISNSLNTDNNLLVTLDQINYYPVIDADGNSDTNCLIQNEIELLYFNGAAFQEIFAGNKICPQGYIEVTTEYCIQTGENTPANYWNAILNCEADGAKLCSWSEWYFACQKTGLGLTNMTNNWEWTESGSNHATSVLIIGNGTCKTAGENNTQIVTLSPYRCCYRKK
jgi:hypothetical protein